jgi:DHA2 family multidrug resistance protein
VLFGTTVLIPQYLQLLMGYTASTAGQALSLGAVVLICMMPLVGQLVSRVDPRYMIAGGFMATALALYHMTGINLQMDFKTAAMYRVYQTFGLAFIFIPINTLAYVGVPQHKSNQVAGMNNLARNLGGSVGISLLGTFLVRLQQTHQNYLASHTSTSNPIFTGQVGAMAHNFAMRGMPLNRATDTAYSMASRGLGLQATTLAYVDIISAGVVLLVCLIPFVFLMQRPPKRMKAPAAH